MPDASFDENAAVRRLMKMLSVPGRSGEESQIAQLIISMLESAADQNVTIAFDSANRRSPIGGQTGNLIIRLRGNRRAPRRLLMGHIDTVPLCVGAVPVREGEYIRPKSQSTALGGDNRAGACVVLTAALEILRQGLPHPPLTLFFPVQEEIGLVGSRYVTAGKLGGPALCFNWDGGDPGCAIIGATGAINLLVEVAGIASHAGAHPEDGVSAAVIAAQAIADLETNGWHGDISKGRRTGTSNIGSIRGGEATNVVMPELQLTSEVRSHDTKFRQRIVREFEKAFRAAARRQTNAKGKRGSVRIETEQRYDSFAISESEPVVQEALAAVQSIGRPSATKISNGGLDANWMTAHGFPTVTLGCGQSGIHTVDERLHIPSFLDACRIALKLATVSSE